MVRKYVKKSKDWRLKKKLDVLVSEFVRRRDKGVCYTCGTRYDWRKMDAGHYIKRSCWRLRFDIRNIHTQCKRCNSYLHGNMDKYALHLIEDYGVEILQEFNRLKDMPEKKWAVKELEDLVKYYEDKIKQLDNKKV